MASTSYKDPRGIEIFKKKIKLMTRLLTVIIGHVNRMRWWEREESTALEVQRKLTVQLGDN